MHMLPVENEDFQKRTHLRENLRISNILVYLPVVSNKLYNIKINLKISFEAASNRVRPGFNQASARAKDRAEVRV